jgi:NAD(P)-dependent dehydrogenase (short-subunit alcohol dehydrogenase family)
MGINIKNKVCLITGGNSLFTKELAKKLEGRPITVNSLHPGIIKTNLLHQLPWIYRSIIKLMSTSTEVGAKTPVYLASSPEVKGISGQFFSNCKPTKTTVAADDESSAKKLWGISMSLLRPDVLN